MRARGEGGHEQGEGARRGRAAWAHGEVREGGVGAAHGEERELRVGENAREGGRGSSAK